MGQPKYRQVVVAFLGLFAICLGVAFWVYRADLPSQPDSVHQTQQLPSAFERATGKRPEDIVRQIETQFNVSLYPTYGSSVSDKYTLNLGLAPNCTGNACYFGDIFISPNPIGTREAGTTLQLTGGVTAYFIDFKCGASCGASTLNWQEGTYYHQVALKGGKQQELVMIANMLRHE